MSGPIRVLHKLEAGFGWHFVSPDVDGMVGGGSSFPESRGRAEHLVRVHLKSRTEPANQRGRTAETVRFEHFIGEDATGLGSDETPPLRPPV